eukprot:UN05447
MRSYDFASSTHSRPSMSLEVYDEEECYNTKKVSDLNLEDLSPVEPEVSNYKQNGSGLQRQPSTISDVLQINRQKWWDEQC